MSDRQGARFCLSIGHVAGTPAGGVLSQARRAALVVCLHELLEFIQRAADHLVLVTGVSDRLACGPVEHPLIDFPVLPLRDIDEFR